MVWALTAPPTESGGNSDAQTYSNRATSRLYQSEKCRAVTYMSANRLEADVLGTKRFVAL